MEHLYENLSHKIIGCAIEVHRTLGPGLLESSYQRCLAHELSLNNISFKSEYSLPVTYKGIQLDCGYRIELLVENKIIIELKAVKDIKNEHKAQLINYLKATGHKLGLLVNFGHFPKATVDRLLL